MEHSEDGDLLSIEPVENEESLEIADAKYAHTNLSRNTARPPDLWIAG